MLSITAIFSFIKALRYLKTWRELFSKKEILIPTIIIVPMLLVIVYFWVSSNIKDHKIANLINKQNELKVEVLNLENSLFSCTKKVNEQNNSIIEYKKAGERLAQELEQASIVVTKLRKEIQETIRTRPEAPEQCEDAFIWMIEQAGEL